MCNPFRQLATGIVQCAIPSGKECWPREKFAQFLGPSNKCPLEMCKTVMESSDREECAFLERKVSLPSPDCVMQPC